MSLQTGIYTQNTPVLFGSGTLAQVGQKAKELGMSKALIITDKGIMELGVPAKIVDSLASAGVESQVWDGAVGDCPTDVIREAVSIAVESGADGFIGVGGGSSMDTCKLMAAVVPNGVEVLDHILDYLYGKRIMQNPMMPAIAIPTTAGTGAEVTKMAVLNDADLDMKVGFPAKVSLAIVDPELAVGSPAGLTAGSGMDAFGHAMESLCAKGCTIHTEMCAYEAISEVAKWLPVAVADKMNLDAREHLAWASNIAGVAFSEDNVHVGHVVAHILGHRYGIGHGLAVAICSPATIEFSAVDYPEKMRKIGLVMGMDVADVADDQIGKAVADGVAKFMQDLKIPSLKEKGVPYDEFMSLGDEVLHTDLTEFYDGEVTIERVNWLLEKIYQYGNE